MMDVSALTTFLAVQRCGGVTRAAAELHLSQPAVSRRLALLERQLDLPLFERVAGGTVLSQAGETLLPFAQAAMAALADAEAAVHAVRSQVEGPVSVALVGTLASTALTGVLRSVGRRYPGIDLTLRTATSHEVSDLVRRGNVTLGLRYSGDPDRGLCCEALFDERLVAVAAADHRLASGRCGPLASLATERWIAFPDVPGRPEGFSVPARRTLEAAGVDGSRILDIDSLTAQKRLVEAGFGLALVPVSGIAEELAAGSLAVLDVEGLDLHVPVTLVTRRGGYLGAAALALTEELRSAMTP